MSPSPLVSIKVAPSSKVDKSWSSLKLKKFPSMSFFIYVVASIPVGKSNTTLVCKPFDGLSSKSVNVVFGSGTTENWYKSALNSNVSWISSGIATIPKSLSFAFGSDL